MYQNEACNAGHGRACLYNWIEEGEVFTVLAHQFRIAGWSFTHMVLSYRPHERHYKAWWIQGTDQAAARFGNSNEWQPDMYGLVGA